MHVTLDRTSRANLVVNNLMARVRTDMLAAGVTPEDRGGGIVTAPPPQ